MNQRIKELIKQATNPDYDSDDGPMNELNIEKFAELIVEECADFVQFYYKDHACEGIARDMKTHFGVE